VAAVLIPGALASLETAGTPLRVTDSSLQLLGSQLLVEVLRAVDPLVKRRVQLFDKPELLSEHLLYSRMLCDYYELETLA
jgi:hypothetical protein